MLFSYPILGTSPLDARLIYLRTMLVAMESLRTGVTSVSDDVYEAPRQDIDRMDAVFQAYRDIGMRATVSGHVIDRTFLDSIPFAREVVPADLQREVDALPGVDAGGLSRLRAHGAAALSQSRRPAALHDGALGAAALLA